MANFYDALHAELTNVTADNWHAKLDALHESHGSWNKLAGELGMHRRTLERRRFGYIPKGGGPRKFAKPDAGFLAKLAAALGKDRRAQVAAVDWRTMKFKATFTINDYPDVQPWQNMNFGQYIPRDDAVAIAAAYAAGDRDACNAAGNDALGEYLGVDATFEQIDSVTFD